MDKKNTCNPELARAFFKKQKYTERFSPMQALQKGTIFPELYCPYENKHCKCNTRKKGEDRYEE